MKYSLTFHIQTAPNRNAYRIICTLQSKTPFPTISKGDIIDPRDWTGKSFEMYMQMCEYGDLLKADLIYHHIEQKEGGSYGNHGIDVFTKIVKK